MVLDDTPFQCSLEVGDRTIKWLVGLVAPIFIKGGLDSELQLLGNQTALPPWENVFQGPVKQALTDPGRALLIPS